MPRIRPPGMPRTQDWISPAGLGKHKGAHSELIACAWLLAQGYEVFRNVSAVGLTDVIAQKGGQILLLDVKSHDTNKLSKEQIAAGVLPLRVSSSGYCRIGFTST